MFKPSSIFFLFFTERQFSQTVRWPNRLVNPIQDGGPLLCLMVSQKNLFFS